MAEMKRFPIHKHKPAMDKECLIGIHLREEEVIFIIQKGLK